MACGRRGHAWGLCALAFLLGCWVAHAAPRVGLYMKESTDVVSLTWDTAPANLHTQLTQLGFDVVQDTVGRPSGDAYIIPVQNGAAFFSSVEDMGAVAQYVSEGGLVVILDSKNGRGEAMKSFVSRALGYEGASTIAPKNMKIQIQNHFAHWVYGSLTNFAGSLTNVTYLSHTGDWALCKQFSTNARISFGQPTLSAHASSFLSGKTGRAWPAQLEVRHR